MTYVWKLLNPACYCFSGSALDRVLPFVRSAQPRNEAAPSQGSTASNKREVIGSKIRQQEQTVQRQQQQVQVTNLAPAHAGDADNGWDGDMGVDLGDCGDDFGVDSGSGSGGVDSCSGMKNRNRGEIASVSELGRGNETKHGSLRWVCASVCPLDLQVPSMRYNSVDHIHILYRSTSYLLGAQKTRRLQH